MASVHKDQSGYRIAFRDADGRKRYMRAGVSKRESETLARHIESIVSAKVSGTPLHHSTASWLRDIGLKLRRQLQRFGIIESGEDAAPSPQRVWKLHDWVDEFIADGRTSKGDPASEATFKKYRSTARKLRQFFPNSPLHEITTDNAREFRQWLERRPGHHGKTMLEASIRKEIATCKVFFNAAIHNGHLQQNPFRTQPSSDSTNEDRQHFISREDTSKLIEAAPDAQWRLLIGLWRLCGLRKMEALRLIWDDIKWDEGKMLVRSSKTKHHPGGASRWVPIGPARHLLEAAFLEAEERTERVISRYSPSMSNLHKPFEKIVINAGLTPWPKLIQNLRSSCETEWLELPGIPPKTIAGWMGHSVKIQQERYSQSTPDQLKRLNDWGEELATEVATNLHEGKRTEPLDGTETSEKPLVLRPDSHSYGVVRTTRLAETGIEPTAENTDSPSPFPNAGNPRGNFPAFRALLIRYGFTPEEIDTILKAARETNFSCTRPASMAAEETTTH